MSNNYKAKASLVHTARAMYAVNWMDIAPALAYIKQSLYVSTVELGELVTAFYAGLFLFQLVGGYLSSLIGDKTTSLIGLFFVGIFAITSGISVTFSELLISRFFAGLSAALFFSPALSLLASIVPKNKYTIHIGLYNAAAGIGSGTGILGWSILDIYIGYRNGFLTAGIVTLILFFILIFLFRNIPNVKTYRNDIFRSLKNVISSKLIIFTALIGSASMISYTIIGQLLVYYLEFLRFSSFTSGLISSLFLLVGFAGGIIAGYHYSMTEHRLAVFISLNALVSILLIVMGFIFNIISIVIVIILMGILTMYGFSVIYAIIRRFARRDLVSLSLSYTNTIQLIIAAIVPLIFTYVYELSNYRISWILMGLISLAFISFIIPIHKEINTKLYGNIETE